MVALAMASGVAATRLEKLRFTNWLNWNCESSVWVGDFVSGLKRDDVAGIRMLGISEFHHEFYVHDTPSQSLTMG